MLRPKVLLPVVGGVLLSGLALYKYLSGPVKATDPEERKAPEERKQQDEPRRL